MSSDITVVARTQHVIVDPISNSVSVVSAGPQGPPGPVGITGPADGVSVADLANHFTDTNVEDVLAEIGVALTVNHDDVDANTARIIVVETGVADNAAQIVSNHSEQVILNSAFNALGSANSAAIVVVETRLTDVEGLVAALETWKTGVDAQNTLQTNQILSLDGVVNNLIQDDVTINGRVNDIEARLDALENPTP